MHKPSIVRIKWYWRVNVLFLLPFIEKAGVIMCFDAVRMREVAKYIGREEILIVDLREKEDYVKGHVPGARSLPFDETEESDEWFIKFTEMVRLYETRINKNIAQIFVYCDRGNTSLLVVRDLNKKGIQVSSLYGGYIAYKGVVERKYID